MNTELLQESTAKVKHELGMPSPVCAIVLGSGWGEVTKSFNIIRSIEYSSIPCMSSTQVKGHAGILHLAQCSEKQILIFQGRRHFYEVLCWEPIAFPLCLCLETKTPTVILTNAAGAINKDYKPGELMLINDHINAMGVNPLSGEHKEIFGPRFPDQSQIYDLELQRFIISAASETDVAIQEGVYIATQGPTYETPAEVASFASMGADAVGMSTVPEAIIANASGMRVAGISCITNMAAGISAQPLSHDEVIVQTAESQPAMKSLIAGAVEAYIANEYS